MGLQGSSGLKRKLRRMERKLDEKPQRAVDRTATSIASNMRANVAFNDAIASSELLNGIVYRPHGKTGGSIISTAPHSGYVEFGTGPRHMSNPYTRRYRAPDFSGALVSALIEWAMIKPTLYVDDPQSVGWAVARRISGETERPGGTDPQPFFFPAWEHGKKRVVRSVETAVRSAVRYS